MDFTHILNDMPEKYFIRRDGVVCIDDKTKNPVLYPTFEEARRGLFALQYIDKTFMSGDFKYEICRVNGFSIDTSTVMEVC